ncbi:hypothetical protein RE735_17835 [Bacillus aerius]|uniref:hypothetical protein n=1 Tax=Bacillus aerius TaxID=293388 RepID=UPI002815877F|nr:hypothetical protein [Bacillus aerius]WMT28898.1 hypothetical protein RE735_17835 [Bacillus aerius]
MKEEEEEKKMATQMLDQTFTTLNEAEALQILNTPKKNIRKTNVLSDIHLSDKERINNATNILNAWKCK